MDRAIIFSLFCIFCLPVPAFADDNERGVEFLCSLTTTRPANDNSDITVYKRRRLNKKNCPAKFNVADADGNVYQLAAIVKATPNVPLEAVCGAELTAEVRFDIGLDGRTINVEAVSGSPDEWVRRSVKAADKERYEPYLVDGKPLEIIGATTIYKGIVEC